MSSSQNLVSLRFNTFTTLSSGGNSQNQTKLQDLATMKTSITTLGPYTTLALMEVDHRIIGRRIMGHPHINHRRGPRTRDSMNRVKGEDQQARATITIEAHMHSNLRTVCITVMRPTIALKIAPSS
jgi:hypothetical protein